MYTVVVVAPDLSGKFHWQFVLYYNFYCSGFIVKLWQFCVCWFS